MARTDRHRGQSGIRRKEPDRGTGSEELADDGCCEEAEGRAERVHVIMATQIPKATIIPTEVRENFDARLCLRTANAIQSRVIMENNGCETLPRYGNGFYCKPEGTQLVKIPYVKDNEIQVLLNWWDDPEHKKRMTARQAKRFTKTN